MAESYGNKFEEDKSSEQERLAGEALRRLQGDAPMVGASHPTPQHDVIQERSFLEPPEPRIVESTDALSWGGGQPVFSENAMHPEMDAPEASRVPAVHQTTAAPEVLLGLRSAPKAIASHTGKHMNGRDIFGGK